MNLRFTSVATAATIIILSTLAGCSSQDSPSGTGGSASGGTHASGGSGGLASAGQSGGSGGGALSTGGSLNTGGQNSAGQGAGGQSTGGVGGSGTSGGGAGGQKTGGGAGGSAGSNGGATTGGSGGGEIVPPTFDTLKLVLKSNLGCLGADCHGGGNQQAPTLTISDKLYTTLTTTMSPDCGNIPLVKPGKPDESALVKIIKGPCGTISRMPAGCTEQDDNCVPAEYIAAITQWVANGAPQ
jgi:hypothetical protein